MAFVEFPFTQYADHQSRCLFFMSINPNFITRVKPDGKYDDITCILLQEGFRSNEYYILDTYENVIKKLCLSNGA